MMRYLPEDKANTVDLFLEVVFVYEENLKAKRNFNILR